MYGAAPGERGRESAAAIAASMRSMRERIERELGGGDGALDLKVGRGGLVDVEFASQYLQLVHGHAHAELRTPSTAAALRAAAELAAAGALPVTLVAPCALLADAYLYLRRIEHRIRMVHDASEQRLPADPAERDVLARRLGLVDGDELLDGYRRWTDEVRRAYDAVLTPSPG